MKGCEYRVAEDAQIHQLVNRLGARGWRIDSMLIEPRLAVNEGGVRILLERRTRS